MHFLRDESNAMAYIIEKELWRSVLKAFGILWFPFGIEKTQNVFWNIGLGNIP